MSGSKWKQHKIIAKEDINKVSDFARFMVTNMGYYFWDKTANKKVEKWEIHNTFAGKELEDVYAGIQVRYERREK